MKTRIEDQESLSVRIRRDEDAKDLPLPSYATRGSSGMDIHAAVKGEVTILPGEIKLIPAGFYMSLPEGFEAQIRPRSGLALKHGISLVNAPGTIDSDYRGMVGIIMTNLGKNPFIICRGDRIAQMIIQRTRRVTLCECDELDDTQRSSGGFGHTGVSDDKGKD